jgi:anti-sigma factor RsiW
VIHWRARRLLAALPDATLPAHTEKRVRAHLARCWRCRAVLRDLEACEALLRRLPVALLPLAPHPAAERRLAGLARWAGRRHAPTRRGRRQAVARKLGALATAAGVAVAVLGHRPAPAPTSVEPFNFVLASAGLERDALAHVPARHSVAPSGGGPASLDLYLLPVGLR